MNQCVICGLSTEETLVSFPSSELTEDGARLSVLLHTSCLEVLEAK